VFLKLLMMQAVRVSDMYCGYWYIMLSVYTLLDVGSIYFFTYLTMIVQESIDECIFASTTVYCCYHTWGGSLSF